MSPNFLLRRQTNALLAKTALRSCAGGSEIPAELGRLNDELMAKAVEIETIRQKARK